MVVYIRQKRNRLYDKREFQVTTFRVIINKGISLIYKTYANQCCEAFLLIPKQYCPSAAFLVWYAAVIEFS